MVADQLQLVSPVEDLYPLELYKVSDSGAVANGYKEKNMTLKIVQAAKSYFDDDPDIKVYYTRLSDTYPSLTERSDLANEVGADRFYSVHINSAGSSATGTETLYNSK